MKEATIQTVKLGVFFMLMFSASNSFSLIATYIYQNKGLVAAGPLNLICNFSAYLISSMLAPKCRMTFKRQMLIGSLGIAFNMSTGLVIPFIQQKMLAYVYISIGGIAAGSTGGYLWISQGGYQREVIKNQDDKGKYSGIFQGFYSLANLFAGVIATFLLGFFSDQVYFSVLTAIALSASIFSIIFFKDIKQEDNKIDSQSSSQRLSLKQTLKSTLKFIPIMWPILLMLILDGFTLGVYQNQVIRLIPKQDDTKQMDKLASILTIFVGVGSIVGGYIGGILCDILKLLKAGRFIIFFYIVAIAMTYLAVGGNQYWFVCVVGFMWGCCYHFFQNWSYVAVLKLYNGKLEAFSVNKIFHSIAFIGFQTVVLVSKNQVNMYYMLLTIGCCALPTIWCLNQQNYDLERESSKEKQCKLNQQFSVDESPDAVKD